MIYDHNNDMFLLNPFENNSRRLLKKLGVNFVEGFMVLKSDGAEVANLPLMKSACVTVEFRNAGGVFFLGVEPRGAMLYPHDPDAHVVLQSSRDDEPHYSYQIHNIIDHADTIFMSKGTATFMIPSTVFWDCFSVYSCDAEKRFLVYAEKYKGEKKK